MKCTFALLCISAIAVSTCLAVDIEPNNRRIEYFGRWEHVDHAKPWCAWQGSSFRTRISGTGLSATIESKQTDYLRVIVDDGATHSKRLPLRVGTHRYSLVDHLEAGPHSIEVVKETYSGPGRMTLHALHVLGDGLVAPVAKAPRLRIQFYGDSNLAGHSLAHEKNKGGAIHSGCYFTFAGIASRMLGAEYQNISRGGAIILGQQNSVMSFYDRIDFYEDEPKWNFARFPADVCVVNIGANDINRLAKQKIKQNYMTLLPAIRQAHPNAHIVVMNGYGWDRNEPANYTQEVLEEWQDENASRLVFPWLFNEWHGCEYDHAGMAKSLVDHLTSINTQWNAVEPMGVMDGFGRNGKVANGSFEFVAPFGGFGWRYFQDGAQRIKDAGSADGEWFLRLPEGKQVHQPNPAVKDVSYNYKLNLRSLDNGGQARVRIEFRDQKWRNEIASSAKEFDLRLGREWKEFTLTVDSPAGTGNPSRDPWQILIRIIAKSGSVDCDNVRLSARSTSEPKASTH